MPAGCPGCDVDHVRGSPDCPTARLLEVLGGKYRLEALVGSGGCGGVYRAVHVVLETHYAVKMLLPSFARDGRVARRFLTEAKTAAALKHPGIVKVTDYGAAGDGAPYLVMEFLEGPNLFQVLRDRGPMGAGEAVTVARGVLEALAVAHAAGVIHRDLKPENLILSRDPDGRVRPKILDFGIAKVRLGVGQKGPTGTGDFVGTLRYASPEQITSSKDVDERTDVYSLGAVIFFLLTGRGPVEGRTVSDVLDNFVRGEIERSPATLRPDVPASLNAVVAKALALRREDRFRNTREMLSALGGQAQEPISIAGTPGEKQARTAKQHKPPFAGINLRWTVVVCLWLLVAAAWWFSRWARH